MKTIKQTEMAYAGQKVTLPVVGTGVTGPEGSRWTITAVRLVGNVRKEMHRCGKRGVAQDYEMDLIPA